MWFPGYVHILDGRVRIKLNPLKGSKDLATKLEQSLLKIKGIDEVKANSITGNVLVLFNSNVISSQTVVRQVNKLAGAGNVIQFPARPAMVTTRPKQLSRFEAAMSDLIIQAAAELVVKRLVLAFL